MAKKKSSKLDPDQQHKVDQRAHYASQRLAGDNPQRAKAAAQAAKKDPPLVKAEPKKK